MDTKQRPVEKYGIVTTTDIYFPGDERSRTNPGHGYPAHTDSYITLKEFDYKEEWENWIKKESMSQYKKPFRAIIFREVAVKTSITIE